MRHLTFKAPRAPPTIAPQAESLKGVVCNSIFY